MNAPTRHERISRQSMDALRIIVERFRGKYINWTLTGSTSLAIQGVDVIAHDIDILTDVENADKIAGLLKDFMIEPMHHKASAKFRSYYGLFNINGVQVEVIADLERIYNDEWVKAERPRIKIIKRYDDLTVPMLDLKEEYNAYMNMDRTEKAEKIMEALKKEESLLRTRAS